MPICPHCEKQALVRTAIGKDQKRIKIRPLLRRIKPLTQWSVFVMSCLSYHFHRSGMPASLEIIAATRGEQKPPWQRPIPARTRRLTASMLRAGTGRWIAATISASVTVSHRQMIFPYRGLRRTASACSSGDISRKGTERTGNGTVSVFRTSP